MMKKLVKKKSGKGGFPAEMFGKKGVKAEEKECGKKGKKSY